MVLHWVEQGVKIFRVDNPHTKPADFWHWLIWTVKDVDPDVLFLAEAFTRPAIMHGLGTLGFTQSYTYFTWRTAAREMREYCEELVAAADHMRPNFWPNTPDILPESLQDGGPAMFRIRAVLASLLQPGLGHVRRVRAVRARGAGRAPRSTSTTRSTSCGPAPGRRPRRRASRWRRC